MLLHILRALLAAATLVHGYANPLPCSGICNNAHDPALIRHSDGTYYRFSTGGKIAIHSAPALTGPWTYKGAAIPAGSKINLKGRDDLWVSSAPRTYHLSDRVEQRRAIELMKDCVKAPDVTLVGDTYYLYYSNAF